MKNLRFFSVANTFAMIFIFLCSVGVSGQKMKPEDIIAKHLEAIGTAETRKKLKNQVAVGLVSYTVLRKGTGGNGKIVLASEADKVLFGMTFSNPSYPAETIVFDGKKSKIGFAVSNVRSKLGGFIYAYTDILEQGLFGGTLSSAWTLANLSNRKAKVEFEGAKKINDKEAFELSYLPKGGSDLQIRIFIDKQTFEHLRTEYRRVNSSRQGATPDSSVQQNEQKQTLIEDFSNYKKESDLNLPHSYRIYLMLEDTTGTVEYEYKAEFSQFFFNQPLDPNSFDTESKKN